MWWFSHVTVCVIVMVLSTVLTIHNIISYIITVCITINVMQQGCVSKEDYKYGLMWDHARTLTEMHFQFILTTLTGHNSDYQNREMYRGLCSKLNFPFLDLLAPGSVYFFHCRPLCTVIDCGLSNNSKISNNRLRDEGVFLFLKSLLGKYYWFCLKEDNSK